MASGIKILLVRDLADQTNTAAHNRNLAVEKMLKAVFSDCQIVEPKKRIKTKNRFIRGIHTRLSLILAAKKAIKANESHPKCAIFLRSIDPFVAFCIWFFAKPRKMKMGIERNEFPTVFIRKTNIFIKLFYQYFVLTWHYCLFDVLFLMTDELIRFYARFAKKSCIIQKLPMTVDFSRFEDIGENHKNKSDYIFYAGSLSEKKDGVESLIHGFKEVTNKHPEICLKIAGGSKDGSLENRLEKIINDYRLEKRVDLLGFVNRDEIPKYLKGAKIVVLPRPESKQAEGGFPTKLGEYLAAETPVIVTRVGEIPKYLSDDDVYFIPTNNIVFGLAEKIEFILSNYNQALRVASSGKIAAKKFFSIETNQAKIQIGFEQAIGKNGH